MIMTRQCRYLKKLRRKKRLKTQLKKNLKKKPAISTLEI